MDELAPGALVDVAGIEVGHATDMQALKGCTVVLCREGAVAGVSVRGLAPGTRETALLRPGTLVEKAHGILLTGGSAFGLAAADGVMRYLEEQGIGHDVGVTHVPIVPAAVLFDLAIGHTHVRPDAPMGYAACLAASGEERRQGNIGAGAGCTVGKIMGMHQAMKAGLGSASLRAGPLIVAALMAVNALGDVIDPRSGAILAGALTPDRQAFLDTSKALLAYAPRDLLRGGNTVIGVVATNARLDVAEVNEIAAVAHDGLARVVCPAHTLYDGDTIFALATGQVSAQRMLVGELAAQTTALAILNGVRAAQAAGELPAACDFTRD